MFYLTKKYGIMNYVKSRKGEVLNEKYCII